MQSGDVRHIELSFSSALTTQLISSPCPCLAHPDPHTRRCPSGKASQSKPLQLQLIFIPACHQVTTAPCTNHLHLFVSFSQSSQILLFTQSTFWLFECATNAQTIVLIPPVQILEAAHNLTSGGQNCHIFIFSFQVCAYT